jgi:hypothetical protein
MGTATKNPRRAVALLKIPEYEVPRFITYARSIVIAMTGNSWFLSPRPSLATVAAAIDELDAAQTATLTRMAGTVAVRDEKRLVLKGLLEQLCAYVQATADANPEHAASIIESSGMYVKKPRVFPALAFTVWQEDISGEVHLAVPQAANRAAYEWAVSTDGKSTWTSLPTTVQAETVVRGLVPGSTAHFRYRTVTKDGTSDWSDPVSTIVS